MCDWIFSDISMWEGSFFTVWADGKSIFIYDIQEADTMKRYNLIIKNAQIHTMDDKRKIFAKGVVGIEGEKITLMKEMSELTAEELQECESANTVIDAEGKVVFPGFIDTHIHIFQSFLKGLGADHRLIEWLNLSALPYGQYMTPHQHELAAQLAKESYLALVDRIRTKVPEISLTTDIIVGFPGETEEDFLETMDVVEKVQYDTAFTFIYSKRTGTPAAGMENGSTKEEIQDRYNRLLRRVQEISDVKTLAIKGQTQPVLVEGFDEKGDGLLTGRLSNNILVHFPGCAEMVGKILNVKLVECKGFYYMGELAE